MAFSKYPEAMTNNAKRGLRLNEEVGGKGPPPAGRETERILTDTEAIRETRQKRLDSFISLARKSHKPAEKEG